MKLIIKEYLASLKERNELDALLPDLLSQMGLNVFISPSRGVKEYGVDIAAVGSISGQPEKIYLLSVKEGNLTRSTWNGPSNQALRPSLDEILDSFIPHRLPNEHKDKPIVVCLCFGGEIHSGIRQNVSGFIETKSTEKISFEEWNGDKLAEFIEEHFLREELVPESSRGLFRKSLALVDEPDISFRHFNSLILKLTSLNELQPKDILTTVRQLYICTWVLFAWCREANNLESVYLASEKTLLYSWELGKDFISKTDKTSKSIFQTVNSIFSLYYSITNSYAEEKIFPHSGKLYALSSGVSPSNSVDVNLKLFDLLGRVSLTGIWSYWLVSMTQEEGSDNTEAKEVLNLYQVNVKKIIANNPILFTPLKDEQAIDITLASLFLSFDPSNHRDVNSWLSGITDRSYGLFRNNSSYPANLYSYYELIEHPLNDSKEYFESVTQGSILFPYISAISAALEGQEAYQLVKNIQEKFLSHCNFQIWFMDEASEEHLYKNSDIHGSTLSDVNVVQESEDYLADIKNECKESNEFNSLSAVKYGFWPIVLLACRHYRLPIPMQFLVGQGLEENEI